MPSGRPGVECPGKGRRGHRRRSMRRCDALAAGHRTDGRARHQTSIRILPLRDLVTAGIPLPPLTDFLPSGELSLHPQLSLGVPGREGPFGPTVAIATPLPRLGRSGVPFEPLRPVLVLADAQETSSGHATFGRWRQTLWAEWRRRSSASKDAASSKDQKSATQIQHGVFRGYLKHRPHLEEYQVPGELGISPPSTTPQGPRQKPRWLTNRPAVHDAVRSHLQARTHLP
jgi:hypothetical protein